LVLAGMEIFFFTNANKMFFKEAEETLTYVINNVEGTRGPQKFPGPRLQHFYALDDFSDILSDIQST